MALFEPTLEALNAADVRYVVVGGVGVVLQGHAVDALTGLGLRARAPVDPSAFADAAERARWISERGMRVFSMVDPNDRCARSTSSPMSRSRSRSSSREPTRCS